jgi:hypothetical protein
MAMLAYSYGALAALHGPGTRAGTGRLRGAAAGRRHDPAADEVIALVDAGRDDEAMRLFVASTFHLSDNVAQAMTAHPMWQDQSSSSSATSTRCS